jgi:hypothetical protein
MMNKEELNRQVELLKTSLEAHEGQVKDISHDLKVTMQRLEDCDKPKLTNKQFSRIHEVIETAISDFNFNEPEAYQMEYGIDYDGKVYADSIEFDGMDTLTGDIIRAVEKLFGVADESDDEDASTEVN